MAPGWQRAAAMGHNPLGLSFQGGRCQTEVRFSSRELGAVTTALPQPMWSVRQQGQPPRWPGSLCAPPWASPLWEGPGKARKQPSICPTESCPDQEPSRGQPSLPPLLSLLTWADTSWGRIVRVPSPLTWKSRWEKADLEAALL